MGKTLYISDLDGTLLRSDERTSAFTNETINRLAASGMLFSYSTARSIVTAQAVTHGLRANIPVMVYNGTFILENKTQKQLLSNNFTWSEAQEITQTLLQGGNMPIVYALINGAERYTYIEHQCSEGVRNFVKKRQDYRRRAVRSKSRLNDGQVFHYTCIDSEEILKPLYLKLKDRYPCIFQRDLYTGEPWLEVMPKNASKANAALELKAILGCDKIVAFGDGLNDLSLFQIADESYAVENAVPQLKKLATGVIPSNNEDGVAKWLLNHAEF